MKYSLRSEHITISPMDEEMLTEKLNRLEKHVVTPFTTNVTIEHDTHHTKGNVVRCTIIIESGKKVFRAERSYDTVQNAIDAAISALKSELSSDHDRRKEHS